MCYSKSLAKDIRDLTRRYGTANPEKLSQMGLDFLLEPIFYANGFDFPKWPVITSMGIMEIRNWGMIPFFTKNRAEAEKLRMMTLNAKAETIFDKRSFKSSIMTNRCLVPVTGFYEWRWMDPKGKSKIPYYIYLKQEEIFSLAGIMDKWVDKHTGEVFQTYAIVTTAANPLMEKIHNSKKRMPVILSRHLENEWLNPERTEQDLVELMQPIDDDQMSAYTISKLITSRTEERNVPGVMKKFDYQELNQTSLNI